MFNQSLSAYVCKGMERIERMFEEKGVILNGMNVDFSLREQSDEDLFSMLRTVDSVHEKIDTPFEVIKAGFWKKIQSQVDRKRRGFLLRHTFGELKAQHMMKRMSTLVRVIKYWETIEEPIEPTTPFWVYETIAEENLPPQRAIERIAQHKKQTKHDVPLTKDEIREEGRAIRNKATARSVPTAEAPTEDVINVTLSGKESGHVNGNDSKCDNVPVIYKLESLSNRDAEIENIEQTKTNESPSESHINGNGSPIKHTESGVRMKMLTVNIAVPEWAEASLEAYAKANRLSVAKAVERFVMEALNGLQVEVKQDANTVFADA